MRWLILVTLRKPRLVQNTPFILRSQIVKVARKSLGRALVLSLFVKWYKWHIYSRKNKKTKIFTAIYKDGSDMG